MARTRYENKKIGPAKLETIEQANAICEEYQAQGLTLTLRQLYYQFVARGLIANKQSEYKRIGDICRDARMAGLMDWDYLIDRTRNLASWQTWKGPQDLLEKSAERYNRDLWKPQKKRVEVWIEKDAAIGVIEGVCRANGVPYFSCRGYTSISEMHEAAQRIRYHIEQGEQVQILHIGDHDPSGLDMSRDIEDRLRTFLHVDWLGLHGNVGRTGLGGTARSRGDYYAAMRETMREHGSKIDDTTKPWGLKRIALNHDQVLQYAPPPNPVKQTDARFQAYVEETGLDESWELDALEPSVLVGLIQDEIDILRDEDVWMDSEGEMEFERLALKTLAMNWEGANAYVAGLSKK